MRLPFYLMATLALSLLGTGCDSSTGSEESQEGSHSLAIDSDTLLLERSAKDRLISADADSVVVWTRTDKCKEGILIPDSLRSVYTLEEGTLTKDNCLYTDRVCEWTFQTEMKTLRQGSWEVDETSSKMYGYSQDRYGNGQWGYGSSDTEEMNADTSETLSIRASEVELRHTVRYCYTDTWASDLPTGLTMQKQGCASAIFTLPDGTSATTRLSAAASDGSRLTYEISYLGQTCTLTSGSFADTPTATQCTQAWKAYQENGKDDFFYWDDWMTPDSDLFQECMEKANYPESLIEAMDAI